MRPLALPVVAALLLSGCAAEAPAETTTAPVEPASSEPAEAAPAPSGNATAPEANATAPPVVDLAVRSVGFYPANPAFETSADSVPSGSTVRVTYTNEDLNPLGKHDWFLEGVSASKTDVIGVGESAEVEFAAPSPGEYVYYCTVDGHRERGMEGTLTVS